MQRATIELLLGVIGIFFTIASFVYVRITKRFDDVESDMSTMRTEIGADIDRLGGKISHQSKALTRIAQAQRVQTQAVSKIMSDQEMLEEAVSELKTSSRLLAQQMEQHQQWHKDMLDMADRDARQAALDRAARRPPAAAGPTLAGA